MLAAEARNGLEVTIRRRQIDVEGVVRLPGDLKPWGCHANQYGMVRPVLHAAWLVLDRQHPHIPYIPFGIHDSDRASGCHEGISHKSEGIYDDT